MEQINNYLGKIQEYGESADGYASDLKLDLADLVLRGLDRNGISQRELAKRAKVSESKISKIVHSDWNWTAKTAAKLLHALSVKATLVERVGAASSYTHAEHQVDISNAVSEMTSVPSHVHRSDVTASSNSLHQAAEEQNYVFRPFPVSSPKWIKSGGREESAA